MGQMIITEIMYNLEGADSPNEFVELFNISHVETIDLSDWRIRDIYSEDTLEDLGFGLTIPPRNFALIMEVDYPIESGLYSFIIPEWTIIIKVDDSSIGNSLSISDSLFIITPNGIVIDSVGWSNNSPESFSIEKRYFKLSSIPGTTSSYLTEQGQW